MKLTTYTLCFLLHFRTSYTPHSIKVHITTDFCIIYSELARSNKTLDAVLCYLPITMLMHLSWSFGLAASAAALPYSGRTNNTATIEDIPSTPYIRYTPCYEKFNCANLELPLDYHDPEAGTTNIAVIKHDATVQSPLGDIIVNPGGPGGSGFDTVRFSAEKLVPILGNSYNLVGMDPRGVDYSRPKLDCNAREGLSDYYEPNSSDNASPADLEEVMDIVLTICK